FRKLRRQRGVHHRSFDDFEKGDRAGWRRERQDQRGRFGVGRSFKRRRGQRILKLQKLQRKRSDGFRENRRRASRSRSRRSARGIQRRQGGKYRRRLNPM